ncbi:hypothetical protein [Thermogutta sp.]|uniref:hypothetical protein n=1 Tax=Thermogutta sp. TaxID=1962930 RepID=UPI00321FEF43
MLIDMIDHPQGAVIDGVHVASGLFGKNVRVVRPTDDLQKAIDRAGAAYAATGAYQLVEVPPFTYTSSIYMRPGVCLRGVHRDLSVIDVDPSPNDGAAIYGNGKNWLQNLTIRGRKVPPSLLNACTTLTGWTAGTNITLSNPGPVDGRAGMLLTRGGPLSGTLARLDCSTGGPGVASKFYIWFRATAPLTAGQIVFETNTEPDGSGTSRTCDIPAIAANRWYGLYFGLLEQTVKSVALKVGNADPNCNLYISDIRYRPSSSASFVAAINFPSLSTDELYDLTVEDCTLDGDEDVIIHTGDPAIPCEAVTLRRCDMTTAGDGLSYLTNILMEDSRLVYDASHWRASWGRLICHPGGYVKVRRSLLDLTVPAGHFGPGYPACFWTQGEVSPVEFEDCILRARILDEKYSGVFVNCFYTAGTTPITFDLIRCHLETFDATGALQHAHLNDEYSVGDIYNLIGCTSDRTLETNGDPTVNIRAGLD